MLMPSKRGYILGIYWGYIGTMEKKMETTGIIRVILRGIYWEYIGDILGIYRDNGKEHGNY